MSNAFSHSSTQWRRRGAAVFAVCNRSFHRVFTDGTRGESKVRLVPDVLPQ